MLIIDSNVEKIQFFARSLVAAIESESFKSVEPEFSFKSLKNFPAGCCKATSFLLGRLLVEQNVAPDFQYVFGERGGQSYSSHVWIEWGNHIVDLTAHQFLEIGGGIRITADRSWHDDNYPSQKQQSHNDVLKGFCEEYVLHFDKTYMRLKKIMKTTAPAKGAFFTA